MPRSTCSTSGSVYRSDYEVYREGKEAFLADEMIQDAPKPPDTNLTAKTCAGKRGNNVYLYGGQRYTLTHRTLRGWWRYGPGD